MVERPPRSRVEVRRGDLPVLLARLPALADTETRVGAPFTDRLVAKFELPVAGWRGRGGRDSDSAAGGSARQHATVQQADEEPPGHA
jgi:hypothetical protein